LCGAVRVHRESGWPCNYRVTEKTLVGTFEQIGLVLGAGFEGAGCGWVEFQKAEDALEAVQRFDGVVFAKPLT
jgi:hypothetical protein